MREKIFNSGQTTVEYILMMAVIVAVVISLSKTIKNYLIGLTAAAQVLRTKALYVKHLMQVVFYRGFNVSIFF